MTCATINSTPATANFVEVWETETTNDFDGDWFDRRIRENPDYAVFVERMLNESETAKRAGRVMPHDEVVSNIRWKLENGIL